MAVSKEYLSGSTYGKGILVAATATLGTTIHQAVNSTTTKDEVWLFATNTTAASVNLTIEWGEATATMNIKVAIPASSGDVQIVGGLLLGNNYTITAFTPVANTVSIRGFVNRIVP